MTSATCARRSGRRSSSDASPGTTSTSTPSAEAIAAASDDELERYLDALVSAPRAAGWPYDEPSGLPAIEAAQPPAGARRALAPGG